MSSGYDLNPDTPAARALQATYKRQSDSAARLPGAQLDLAYGPHPRQKLDVFSAGSNAPVILFFHGGYWTAGSKDARRFPSPTWIEHGVSWVAINYRLTPENALKVCVADARAATNWIAGNAATMASTAAAASGTSWIARGKSGTNKCPAVSSATSPVAGS